MKLAESYGAYPSSEIEVVAEVDKFRIRVREPHGKASIFLNNDELEKFGRACIEMALSTRLEPK